jgi:hypothetical protein
MLAQQQTAPMPAAPPPALSDRDLAGLMQFARTRDIGNPYVSRMADTLLPAPVQPTDFQRKRQWFEADPGGFVAFNMATRAGQKPTVDFSGANFGPGAPSPGTEKMFEFAGKNVDDRVSALRERANLATQNQSAINRVQRALEQYGETGRSEELKKTLRQAASTIGLPIDVDRLANAEQLEAASNQLIAEQLRLNKGPQTDFDAEFTGRFLPSLGRTSAANREVVAYQSSINRLARIANQIGRNAYGNALELNDFMGAQEVLNQAEDIISNTPAVVKNSKGEWVQFDDFYKKARRAGKSDEEIVAGWQAYAQRRTP